MKTRMGKPPQALVRLTDEAATVFKKHFTADCCLNATRVLLEATRVLMPKARVRPLMVEAVAANKAATELMLEHGVTQKQWEEAGAHLVACGQPDTSGPGWAGHLGLLVNEQWFLDGSAYQLNRPEKSILIEGAVLVGLTNRHLHGIPAFWKLPEGGQLAYQVRPNDRSFLGLPGFAPHEANLRVAAELRSRLK